MSVLDKAEPIAVPLGACYCSGTPHTEDIVYLVPELSMPSGLALRALVLQGAQGMDPIEVQRKLGDLWLQVAIVDWTFLDDEGDPIPVTADTVLAALPYAKGGRLVADKADDLYADSVIGPLVLASETLLKRGWTRTSRKATSPATTSRRKRPSPSLTPATDKAPPAA